MIRRSVLSIQEANPGKLSTLNLLAQEMSTVVNKYIVILWEQQDFSSKFVTMKVQTWLSARMQQCMGKQALEIVKSQRKKKKKSMPVFKAMTFSLDSRFVDFHANDSSFDIWIRLSSLGNKLSLWLPAKAHKHYNKFQDWTRSKSIRLSKGKTGWCIEVFFEKDAPKIKTIGKTIGVDLGYKKLLVTSENKVLDKGLESIYEKIARKEQGSNAFKRALLERDNLINQSINELDLTKVQELVVEDLVNVKRGVKNRKRKIAKKFMNKLQRWSYVKCLDRLQHMAEEAGVLFTKVNPAYTSQKCCICGVVCTSNRRGSMYKCACGNVMDADLNASINISHMGVYSPHVSY